MDYQKLDTELQLPAYSGLSDADAAAAINADIAQPYALIKLWAIKQLGLEQGWWANLLGACESEVQQVRLLAKSCVDYVQDPHFEHLDPNNAATQQMMGGLVAIGVMTQPQLDAVLVLGAVAPTTRAAQLGLPAVSEADVNWARNQYPAWLTLNDAAIADDTARLALWNSRQHKLGAIADAGGAVPATLADLDSQE